MHVVIVGGGIVGTTAAARLTRTDHEVTLVERSTPGSGTTTTSAAQFMRASAAPNRFDFEATERSWETYGPLVEAGEISQTPCGMLYVAETPSYADQLADAAATLESYGLEVSSVAAADLADFGIERDRFAGGLYSPTEGYFDPDELVAHFLETARERGVDVRTGTEVVDVLLATGAARGVETANGTIEADAVVNAAGPWAHELNGFAGVSLPLCHALGPMLVLEGESIEDLPFAVFESKEYLRPAGPNRTYFGRYDTSYVEGRLVDPTDLEVDDDHRNAVDSIGDVVPAMADASVVDEWVGVRTITPDGRPFVGETSVPGLYVACGMSGLGITLSPAVADALAGWLEGTVDPEVRTNWGPQRTPESA